MVGSESGQKHSVKFLQNMVNSTVCILYIKIGKGRGATVHKYSSFVHGRGATVHKLG